MRPPAIRCFGLSKQFGPVRAVELVNLAVDNGEKMALTGPSGCGKTTLLRLIAGFEMPSTGVLAVGGDLVAGQEKALPPEKRRVGMVFQDYALFPHMDVWHNVAYGVRDKSERESRVGEVLELVGLSTMQRRLPHELSGGEQQRVALARALAPRPAVVLLDEPFSNLDAGLRARVRAEVRQILSDAGASAILVTHNREGALFFGDRVAVMNQGRIEQVDTPERIFHRPVSQFVARFMGIADFIPAKADGDALVTELGTLPRPSQAGDGAKVEVMVRPDDISIQPEEAGQGRVVERVFQGAHNLYKVELPSGATIHSLRLHYEIYAEGEAVSVRIDPGHGLMCSVNGKLVEIQPTT